MIKALRGNFHFFINKGNGSFEEGSHFEIKGGSQVILIDINHDQHDDMVYWSYSEDSVGFLLNDKQGDFEEKVVIYDQLNKVADIDINDYDQDGDLDIVAVSNSPGKLVLFENIGGLHFADPEYLPYRCRQPQSVAFADMNGDGFLDIVTTDSAADDVSVYTNKGNDLFDIQQKVATIDWADKLFIHDIDDDGDLDIFVGQTYGSAAIIYNETENSEGFLTFSEPEFSIYVIPNTDNRYENNYGAWTIWSVDIDGDCDQDVITQEEKLFLFENLKQDHCSELNPNKEEAPEIALTVYPNPASDQLNISVEHVNLFQTNIISLKGELLFSVDNETKIDLTDIPSGIYILQLRDLEKRITKCEKFVVAK